MVSNLQQDLSRSLSASGGLEMTSYTKIYCYTTLKINIQLCRDHVINVAAGGMRVIRDYIAENNAGVRGEVVRETI